MDGKSLLLSLVAVALAASYAQHASAASASENPTYLSGFELANRLLPNVVLIGTKEGGKGAYRGAGFVIGIDGEWIHLATALHALRKPENGAAATELSESITLRFCAAGSGDPLTLPASDVYFIDEDFDLAAFRIRAPAGFVSVQNALSAAKPKAGDQIWSLGKEGECKIGVTDGAIDKAQDSFGNLTIDIAGAYGGTSGSPVITDRGIVGLVWSSAESVKVTALSIEKVRERLATSPTNKWTLLSTNNLPAGTREAASWELTKALNDYVFTAKDMRDAFVKDTYYFILLGPVVDRYNVSIKAFNEVKDRHDGTLERQWGTKAREEYAAIRDNVASVHARILSFNKNMDQLRRGNRIPKPIREQMMNISPDIDVLDQRIQQFLRNLKKEHLDDQQ